MICLVSIWEDLYDLTDDLDASWVYTISAQPITAVLHDYDWLMRNGINPARATYVTRTVLIVTIFYFVR